MSSYLLPEIIRECTYRVRLAIKDPTIRHMVRPFYFLI